MKWVVILFGTDGCEGYEGMNTCPMSVHGFDNETQAAMFLAECPEWARPHKMSVQ
jgi:hypothetical protein